MTAADFAGGEIRTLRLAALLVRFRWRHSWNAFRARPTGPSGLVVLFGFASAFAYVGLFVGAMQTIGQRGGVRAETTALALMVGAFAFAGLAQKASGEGLFAGTPENEFLLARPVSLARLVGARCIAALVTDPFGTLFLLPVLIAAAVAWNLPLLAAVPIAAATSIGAQAATAAVAQLVQVTVVRWIPARRRSWVFVTLRLVAALAMGAVWIAATWVLRSPAQLVPRLAQVERWLAFTPAGLLAAPLAQLRRAGAAAAVAALAVDAAIAVVAAGVAVLVARRAGMRGWEEAGAPWAETSALAGGARVGARGRSAPPLTLVRREWRQLLRDRPRLVALAALPALFFGVNVFGTIGWAGTTATLTRIAMLAFSITLYMAGLGPLAHMQAERRAFWIVRAAPVSVGRVMAAKARAWAAILGPTAAAIFLASVAASPSHPPAADVVRVGLLVAGGGAGMAVLAVALACLAADLSDESRSAIGPGTVYLFLLVGGLYNLALDADAWTTVRILLVYAFAIAAFWRSGMAKVEICLDAEMMARRSIRPADAAVLVVLAYLGPVAVRNVLLRIEVPRQQALIGQLAFTIAIGLAAAVLLWRRRAPSPAAPAPSAWRRRAGLGAAVGLAAGLALQAVGRPAFHLGSAPVEPLALAVVGLIVLSEEAVFRGVVQRAYESSGAGATAGARWPAALAAAGASVFVSPTISVATVVVAVAATYARAATGSLGAAVVARGAMLAVSIALR